MTVSFVPTGALFEVQLAAPEVRGAAHNVVVPMVKVTVPVGVPPSLGATVAA